MSAITRGSAEKLDLSEVTAVTVVIKSTQVLLARWHLSLGRWCCQPRTAAAGGRFTNNGIAVANMRVAVTQRIQQDGEWRDGDTSFLRVNVWR